MTKELNNAIAEQLCIYKKLVSSEALSEFANLTVDELPWCHFGLGLYLRNNILLPDSKLHKLFEANHVTHKDDMSAAMIRYWHKALNAKRFTKQG